MKHIDTVVCRPSPMKLLLGVVYLWVVCSARACGRTRGCNAPTPYSSLALGSVRDPLYEPTYISTPNFDPSLASGAREGVDIARRFLGSATNARVYLIEANGEDAAYVELLADWCDFLEDPNRRCGESQKHAAQNGGGQYFLSGVTKCECDGHTYVGAPMVLMPNSQDRAPMVKERAVHEYTHIFQHAMGMPWPDWMGEGGAVFLECFMFHQTSAFSSYASCFRYGGGGGGIIRNVRALYNKDPKRKWLTEEGEDRGCTGPEDDEESDGPPVDRLLYYDVGAYAVAFAVHRANANHQSSGGRSSADFWHSEARGFWHRIEPYPIDLVNGYASSVPEGQGWKRALTEFTGDATVADFYAAFEEFVAPGGVVASEEVLLSVLEPEDAVKAMAQIEVDVYSEDYVAQPRSACSVSETVPSPSSTEESSGGSTLPSPPPSESTPAPTSTSAPTSTPAAPKDLEQDSLGAAASTARHVAHIAWDAVAVPPVIVSILCALL